MQLPGKLVNQTWENGEKPNFGLFGPNLSLQFFFVDSTCASSQTSSYVPSYHPMSYKGKLMNQT